MQRKLSELLTPFSIMGALTALFLLMGRWSPFRPEINWDELIIFPLYIELRLYLIATMLVCGLSFAHRLPRGAGRLSLSFLCLMLFLFIGIASGFGTPQPGVLLEYFARKQADFILLALALPVIYFYSASRDFNREVWRWMYIVTVTLLIIGLVSLVQGVEDGRLAILKGGPNIYGRLMGLLVIAAAARYFTEKRLITPSGIVLALAGLVLLTSGSRGAVAAIAITAALGIFMVGRSPMKVLLLLGAAAFGMLLILFPPLEVFELIRERYIVLTFEEQYVAYRDVLFDLSLDAIRERFWLGHGLAGFSAFEPNQVYPHNLVLELWTEFGLVGIMLALVVPTIAILVRVLGSNSEDHRNTFAFIFLLAATMFSGDFYDSRGVYVFAFLILGQARYRIQPAKARPSGPRAMSGQVPAPTEGRSS